MNDFDQWEQEEVARRRAEADAEDADPAYRARIQAKREAEDARNARMADDYAAEKAALIEIGEWIDEADEDEDA